MVLADVPSCSELPIYVELLMKTCNGNEILCKPNLKGEEETSWCNGSLPVPLHFFC